MPPVLLVTSLQSLIGIPSNLRWVRGRDQRWGGRSKHSNRVSGLLPAQRRQRRRSPQRPYRAQGQLRRMPWDPGVTASRRGWRTAHSGLDAFIAHLANHQKAPHLSKWSLSSTGGGALRWPSGSTLVRIDGPPSLRAAHPPSLTAGPATSDGTLARPRLQEAGCPGREWVSLNRSHGTWA